MLRRVRIELASSGHRTYLVRFFWRPFTNTGEFTRSQGISFHLPLFVWMGMTWAMDRKTKTMSRTYAL